MIFCKRCGNYAADGVDACPKCSADLFDSGHPSLVGGVIQPASAGAPPRAAAAAAAGAMFGYESEPAGHLQRFLALFIDSLLLGFIVGLGSVAMVMIGGATGLLIFAATLLIFVAYEPYFIAAKGATPGKSVMGLHVINRDGGPVGAGQAVARWLLKTVLNFLFIPLFLPLFTARRQGLHDMIVSTYVVRA